MHLELAAAFVIRTPVEALRKSPDSELMRFRIYLIKRDRRDSPMGNTATHIHTCLYRIPTPHSHSLIHTVTLTHTRTQEYYININVNVLNPCRLVLRYGGEYRLWTSIFNRNYK